MERLSVTIGTALLPKLTPVVSALNDFINTHQGDIAGFGDQLAAAFTPEGVISGIKGITSALGPLIDLVKIAAAPVKAITQAFLSLPKEVQTVLIGAFAVNKLTGGLVTNAAGGIIEAIGKGLLGGIKAPLVNVSGGVVNVAGGVGGVPGAAGGAASLGVAQLIPLAGLTAVGLAAGQAAAEQVNKDAGTKFKMPAGFLDIPTQVSNLVQAVQVLTKAAPKAFQDSPANRNGNSDPRRSAVSTGHPGKVADDKVLTSVTRLSGKMTDDLTATTSTLSGKLADDTAASKNAGTYVGRTVQAGASTVAAAVRASTPIIYNNISISATTVTKVNTVVNRYGSTAGSRNSQASRQTPI
jgi:hypothetical protein